MYILPAVHAQEYSTLVNILAIGFFYMLTVIDLWLPPLHSNLSSTFFTLDYVVMYHIHPN